MTTVVGIDLGTTTSAIALMKDGQPTVITTSEGKRIPSVVSFGRSGEQLVGKRARRQAALNPRNTVFSVKRLLGRRYGDPETATEQSRAPYRLTSGAEGGVRITLPHSNRELTPQEIAAYILKKLKQEAETYLGQPVQQAVITAPAYFNDTQRQAVKEAGRLAGLDVLRIINEPTAAALAYGRNRDTSETVLVVDLGGGAYDVSVLELDNGMVTVKASHGDTFLGGADWDAAITDWLLDKFLRQYGIDLRKDQQALQRVWQAAERAKIELSTSENATIDLPFIITNVNGPKHLRATLTRSRFETLTASLADRLVDPLQQALDDANVKPSDLDAVLLVGGASRIPAVQDRIRSLTDKEPGAEVDPNEVVVLGAALQAGMLAGNLQELQLREVTPLSLGLETMGGLMTSLIPRNTPIPARRTEVFSTIYDEQTSVEIHVLQGERQMAADNAKLGVFRLDGIPKAPRGVPQIEITFEIDEDGILHVSALDMGTGASRALSISSESHLSDNDVEQMVEEAEQHAAEDQERRDLIEARNVAQQIIYQTERSLQHLNGHTSDAACQEKKKEIVRQIAMLKIAVLGRDTDEIRELTADLQRANLVLSQLAYDRLPNGSSTGRSLAGNQPGESNPRTDITIETI
ncbi:MAG TPA: molecular chaperone DnaK [Candidatus Sulfomarinibacteraceae bacterium]|nr:molecular chaperone DnaK [Candidatus Sulfomarinibacteraceae bacterium]